MLVIISTWPASRSSRPARPQPGSTPGLVERCCGPPPNAKETNRASGMKRAGQLMARPTRR
jgi:hypothetical protein